MYVMSWLGNKKYLTLRSESWQQLYSLKYVLAKAMIELRNYQATMGIVADVIYHKYPRNCIIHSNIF